MLQAVATLNDDANLHYTFYTQSYLFFPRRIHAYLTAKPLPSHIKTTFVPVSFDSSGLMTKPAGKIDGTIPMLRYGPSDGDFIRQSVAILNYLEEAHPMTGAEYAAEDMRGGSPMERARVSEIVALVEEAGQGPRILGPAILGHVRGADLAERECVEGGGGALA